MKVCAFGGSVLGWSVLRACVCSWIVCVRSACQSALQAEELTVLFEGEKITFKNKVKIILIILLLIAGPLFNTI